MRVFRDDRGEAVWYAQGMSTEAIWQPIETAPKDETEVLLYCPDDVLPQWSITTGWADNHGWHLVQTGGYAEDNDVYPNPTHWMPLPKPPML